MTEQELVRFYQAALEQARRLRSDPDHQANIAADAMALMLQEVQNGPDPPDLVDAARRLSQTAYKRIRRHEKRKGEEKWLSLNHQVEMPDGETVEIGDAFFFETNMGRQLNDQSAMGAIHDEITSELPEEIIGSDLYDRCEKVFRLRIHGWPFQRIAEALSISIRSAKSDLDRYKSEIQENK